MDSAGKIRLDVVKPDGLVLSEAVDEVVVPGEAGFFGVRKGHAPFLTLLGTGELWYRIGSVKHHLGMTGGFCEVGADRVTVLAEAAERAEDIDIARAERARDRAEAHVKSALAGTDSAELERAQTALVRARMRLEVAARRSSAGSH